LVIFNYQLINRAIMATHKEYTLTFKEDCYEHLDSNVKAIHRRKGDTIVVNEETFKSLQAGKTIERMVNAGHGMMAMVTYDKYTFENDVTVLLIETSASVAKLGQRKSKS
jgi:hypothetical protein